MKHHYPNCDLGDKCQCDATDDFLDTFPASSDAVKNTPVAMLPADPQLLSEGLSVQRLVVRLRGRCLRVVKRPNIWVDREFWYPEERPKWWPFWFRFEDGCGGQIFFREESEAWEFLQRVFPHNDRDLAPPPQMPENHE